MPEKNELDLLKKLKSLNMFKNQAISIQFDDNMTWKCSRLVDKNDKLDNSVSSFINRHSPIKKDKNSSILSPTKSDYQ